MSIRPIQRHDLPPTAEFQSLYQYLVERDQEIGRLNRITLALQGRGPVVTTPDVPGTSTSTITTSITNSISTINADLLASIRDALEVNGSVPLDLTGLRGYSGGTQNPIFGTGTVLPDPLNTTYSVFARTSDFTLWQLNTSVQPNVWSPVHLSHVIVSAYANGGDGTVAHPWTGWDTRIIWLGSTVYFFPAGHYSLAASPVGWSVNRMCLVGTSGVYLHFTGAGNAFFMSDATGKFDCLVAGLNIIGNAATTNGFYTSGIHRSRFLDLRVGGCTTSAFRQAWGIENEYDHCSHSDNDRLTLVAYPTNGALFEGVGGSASTSTTMTNCSFDSCTGAGIKLDKCTTITLVGCTSEFNGGSGLEITVNADMNTVVGIHLEANGAEAVSCDGGRIYFSGGYASGLTATGRKMRFTANAVGCKVFGGMFDTVQVDAGAVNTDFNGVTYNLSGAGVWTDNGTDTSWLGVQTAVGVQLTNKLKSLNVAGGTFEVKSQKVQSGLLTIKNNAGTVQHNYCADFNSIILGNFTDRILNAAAGFTNTPQVSNVVNFAAGGGVVAAATNRFLLDTAAQNVGDQILLAFVVGNDTTTDLMVGVGLTNLNINGTTRQRPALTFTSTVAGAAYPLTAASIPAGKSINVQFILFVL